MGDIFHGRYRLVRLVKAGGMGAVYEVFDQSTDGRRALKVMLPAAFEDPELRERFARETKLAGSIESDHVVRVSDAGTDADTNMPFMVMELLDGEELAVLAKRHAKLKQPLPHADVVTYLLQAARALDKVHARGVVHRDLKPENLFLTRREDGTPCVKVLDFGIARLIAQSADSTSTVPLGTPKYMAPEQIRGKSREIGPAVDIYALGQVAYTLLVGEAYWTEEAKDSDAIFVLLARILCGPDEPPSARAKRRDGVVLPTAFDPWFLKATAVEPGERFGKATACIAALGDALGVRSPLTSSAAIDAEPTLNPGATAPEPVLPTAPRATLASSPTPSEGATGPLGSGSTTQPVASKALPRLTTRPKTFPAGLLVAGAVVVLGGGALLKVLGAPSPEAPLPAVSVASGSSSMTTSAPVPTPSIAAPSALPSIAPTPSIPVSAKPPTTASSAPPAKAPVVPDRKTPPVATGAPAPTGSPHPPIPSLPQDPR